MKRQRINVIKVSSSNTTEHKKLQSNLRNGQVMPGKFFDKTKIYIKARGYEATVGKGTLSW